VLDISLPKLFLFILLVFSPLLAGELEKQELYQMDDACKISLNYRHPNSHLNVYIPSLPYAYIMRLINGTLVRLDDSDRGWDYFIAYKHEKLDPLTYDFWLREDVRFQDGTKLDADAVVRNFNQFQKGAFTYTDIHNKLKFVEKIDDFRIRIHLNEPYGMLLNDLARISLYTDEYYKHHSWTKSITGVNTAVAGPFGSGPYILASGHATGLSHSKKVVLKANPYYFEKDKPYIKTITVHTQMPIDEVVDGLANHEGRIDIAFIPLNKKTEIVNSKYAKLFVGPSKTTLSTHINLMNKENPLQDLKKRQALNQAIDQEKLITFVYKNEGEPSPFPISNNYISTKDISQRYFKNPPLKMSEEEISFLLKDLKLKVVTQDRFLSIWKGIEYQLLKYGVKIEYDITSDEKYVFHKLLTNRENRYDWDILTWGNEEWYGHPWTSFFTIYTKNQWSAVEEDEYLDSLFREFFKIEQCTPEFKKSVEEILEYIYDKAYMLSIPSPNLVIGMNKEVDFMPSTTAIMRLWEAKITPYHWSIRDEELPKERERLLLPKRVLEKDFEE